MKKLLLLLALVVGIGASSVFGGNISQSNPHSVIWRDMFFDPNDRATIWDGYVEAAPGETVTVFVEVNNNYAGWSPIRGYRAGFWWDTAALDRPQSYWDYSQAPLVTEDGVGSYGTATQGEYWGSENASYYGGANYQEVEIGGLAGYNYQMRLMGITFDVLPTAPLGITTVGLRVYMYDYWSWYWRSEARIESDDPFALQINIIPEPATMSLLAIGGVAALIRRRRK